jgi:hypothetical protein
VKTEVWHVMYIVYMVHYIFLLVFDTHALKSTERFAVTDLYPLTLIQTPTTLSSTVAIAPPCTYLKEQE